MYLLPNLLSLTHPCLATLFRRSWQVLPSSPPSTRCYTLLPSNVHLHQFSINSPLSIVYLTLPHFISSQRRNPLMDTIQRDFERTGSSRNQDEIGLWGETREEGSLYLWVDLLKRGWGVGTSFGDWSQRSRAVERSTPTVTPVSRRNNRESFTNRQYRIEHYLLLEFTFSL